MANWLREILDSAERRMAARPDWARSDHAKRELAKLKEVEGPSLSTDVHDLVLAVLTQAVEGPDLAWAIEAAQAAAAVAGYKEGLEFEARIVGPHLLVTVLAKHLGRRRNWAQARVPWMSEALSEILSDIDSIDAYKAWAAPRIAEHVARALDGRSR